MFKMHAQNDIMYSTRTAYNPLSAQRSALNANGINSRPRQKTVGNGEAKSIAKKKFGRFLTPDHADDPTEGRFPPA